MTVGEKIRHIRNFRGLTQKELGLKIGLDAKSADNRMAQYETNYRVPKKDMLVSIAKALDVNPINFIGSVSCSAENIMLTFFWLDEDNRGAINLFQLVRNPCETNTSDDTSVRYYDNDNWPAHPPVGMWFGYGLINKFMREWMKRKEELKTKKISNEEYLEWKLNWPASSSTIDKKGDDKEDNSFKWRK